jgi:hypothetical protein
MPEHRHRLSQACHNAAALGLPGTRDATEVITSRVQQPQRPETEADDPLAARSAPSPEPTLADVASWPKQEPCESIRITT